MSSLSQFAQAGKIKSIQRGLISISTGASSSSATVTAVDTSKSILHLMGHNSAYVNEGFGITYNLDCYLSLTNSTTVTATRSSAGSLSQTVSWQLVEYY